MNKNGMCHIWDTAPKEVKAEANDLGFAVGTPEYKQHVAAAVTDYREEVREKRQENEHNRQMILIQAQQNLPNTGSNANALALKAVPRPNPFDPTKGETLDHFFNRWEQYCDLMGLDSRGKAIGLSNLLPPDLNIILESMSAQDRINYPELKATLLKAVAFTPEGYRKRLIEAKPLEQDNFSRYLQRMRLYIREWMEVSSVPKNFDSMCDFLAIDITLHQLPPNFVSHIKDRYKLDITAMGKVGDNYVEVHHPNETFNSLYLKQEQYLNRQNPVKKTLLGSTSPKVPRKNKPVASQPSPPGNNNFSHFHSGSRNTHPANPQRPNSGTFGYNSPQHFRQQPNLVAASNSYPRTPVKPSPTDKTGSSSPYCSLHKSNTHNTSNCRSLQYQQKSPMPTPLKGELHQLSLSKSNEEIPDNDASCCMVEIPEECPSCQECYEDQDPVYEEHEEMLPSYQYICDPVKHLSPDQS